MTDVIFKRSVILGDTGVGKSALHRALDPELKATPGKDRPDEFCLASSSQLAGQDYILNYAECQHEVSSNPVALAECKRSDTLILVADVTKRVTIDNLDYYLSSYQEAHGNAPNNLIIIGNKVDASHADKPNNCGALRNIAHRMGGLLFLTSATEGLNIRPALSAMINTPIVPFSGYLKWYKSRLFGTHHIHRATAVKNALLSYTNDGDKLALIENQMALMEGKEINPLLQLRGIGPAWTHNRVKNCSTPLPQSGYYRELKRLHEALTLQLHGYANRRSFAVTC